MSEFITGLTKLAATYKSIGGKWLKGTAIELFFDTYHDEIVKKLAEGLAHIPPGDVPKIIHDQMALPIPRHFFEYLKGFEDYVEGFDPGRLFGLISEANPLVAAAIMDQGEEGANYMVRFKAFVLDSVRDIKTPEEEIKAEKVEEQQTKETEVSEDEVEEPSHVPHLRATVISSDEAPAKTKPAKKLPKKPPRGFTRLHCDKCEESWDVLVDDVSAVKECPFCHQPA